MAGLYFEEFEVGQLFKHSMTRTVTEMDNVLFSTLTMNPQPLHLDKEFASKTEFGQILVNSLFTLALVIGITVGETTLGTTIANLGMADTRFPHPVFYGDTVTIAGTVTEKNESIRIITMKTEIRKENRIVTSGEAKVKVLGETP